VLKKTFESGDSVPVVKLNGEQRDALRAMLLAHVSGVLGDGEAGAFGSISTHELFRVLEDVEDTGAGDVEITVLRPDTFRRVFSVLQEDAAALPDAEQSALVRSACAEVLSKLNSRAAGRRE